jgi:hypothetical protein
LVGVSRHFDRVYASLPVSDQMDASQPLPKIDVPLFLSNLYFFIADLLHSRSETFVPSFFFSPSKLMERSSEKVPHFFSSFSKETSKATSRNSELIRRH